MSGFARQKGKERTGNRETRFRRLRPTVSCWERSTTEFGLGESGSFAPHRPEGALGSRSPSCCVCPGCRWPGRGVSRSLRGCSQSQGPPPHSLSF